MGICLRRLSAPRPCENERVARPRERDLPEVAGAAGVPDTIWNMDARAGAVTAAYVKGAQPTDAMDLGTHTQLATNRRFPQQACGEEPYRHAPSSGKNEPGNDGA